MASEHEAIPFILIDAEKNPNSRKLANLSNLPTFAAFKKGSHASQVQTNKTEVLKTFVDEITAH